MNVTASLPRFCPRRRCWGFIRWLDKHGWCLDFLIGKDPESAVWSFISNLGSIHLKSATLHLTNWARSLFCIIGEKEVDAAA